MNGYDAQDMATQGAEGFRNGYQAGYADAWTHAAQDAVWTEKKPIVEGNYYVRGFNLFESKQYKALVQVRMHQFDGESAPELVCNIHESTSNDDMDDWSPMVNMSDDFEWFGPLYAAPVAAAPVDLHARLLHLLGAKDHEDAGRIIGELHATSMSTPAAPGIDLELFREPVNYWHNQCSATHGIESVVRIRSESKRLLALIDQADASPKGEQSGNSGELGSPKGGSDVRESIASVIAELESAHVQNNKYRMGCLGADNIDTAVRLLTALQATSAEVGS